MHHQSRRRVSTLGALLCASVLLSIAPAALAADRVTGSSGSPVFIDNNDNADVVTVSQAGSTVTFHNDSDTMTTDNPDCTAAGNDVTCTPLDDSNEIQLNLGGGNDQTTFSGIQEFVSQDGGSGDDTLGAPSPFRFADTSGGDGNDTLQGTEGTLNGGAGNDTLTDVSAAGSFADLTFTGGPGTDTYNAGNAFDTVSFGDRTNPVTVTLDDQANDGEAGENENVPSAIDNIRGGSGNDTLTGSDGDNSLDGAGGDDTLNGQGGDDFLAGEDGNDSISGGNGSDFVEGDNGNDTLNGNDGDDSLEGDNGADVYNGGNGIDSASLFGPFTPPASPPDISVTLDGQANDGVAGEGDNVQPDVENVDTAGGADHLTGSADFNALSAESGNDTVDGSTGSDVIDGGSGDDTMQARDGFPDRVTCGPGADRAVVDQLDSVSGDCETVDRATTASPLQDRPPTVTIGGPAANATLKANTPTTVTANASDDKGIKQVVFMANDRVVCTDTTAPYSCAYQPTGSEVNRDTLTVAAVDTSDQAAFALRTVNVSLFTGTLSQKTTPKRDAKSPFHFTTTGKLALPAAAGSKACSGTVTMTFKAGKKTVSTRRAKLTKKCTYSSTVTFRVSRRLHPKALTVQARFGGNSIVQPGNSKRSTVRVR